MAETKLFLGASQLASMFEVDPKSIHNWVDRGLIPGKRTPGGHLRFDPVEVRNACEGRGELVPSRLVAFIAGDVSAAPAAKPFLKRASVEELTTELTRRGLRVSVEAAAVPA
jgi:hypothetical protein